MNRAQRRRAQKLGRPQTFGDWLKEPELIVRRGEVFEIVMRCVELDRINRRRRSWWYRALKGLRILERGAGDG